MLPREQAYVLDMLVAARRAVEFSAGKTREQFLTDAMLQYATERALQIIGEAARRVSQATREAHPGIPWREIVGFRNLVVHEYARVAPGRVWDLIQHDLPRLIAQLEPLVPEEER